MIKLSKHMKKVLLYSLLLTNVFLLFLCPFTNSRTFGSSPNECTPVSRSAMTKELVSSGYPSDQLECYTDTQLQLIYYSLASAPGQAAHYTFAQNRSQENSPSPVDLRTDLLIATENIDGQQYVSEMHVAVSYQWKRPHFLCSQDYIEVRWSDGLSFVPGSFVSSDFYYSLSSGGWVTYRAWEEPAHLSNQQLGVYTYLGQAENIAGTSVSPIGSRGTAIFSLRPPRGTLPYSEYISNKVIFSYSHMGDSYTI